jgi:hypothetical protein
MWAAQKMGSSTESWEKEGGRGAFDHLHPCWAMGAQGIVSVIQAMVSVPQSGMNANDDKDDTRSRGSRAQAEHFRCQHFSIGRASLSRPLFCFHHLSFEPMHQRYDLPLM